jgi:bacillithiol biosynthesis cysteine-adding enzyme BshC
MSMGVASAADRHADATIGAVKRSLALNEYPAASPFIRFYALGFNAVARWFHYDPHNPRSMDVRLRELDGIDFAGRRAAAQALAAQQQRWGSSEAAVRAARELGEPGTYAVVAGQQTGLFGGPLYTQLKAVTIVKLARGLAARYPGRRFVPVFWMATSDSDFDEVRQAFVLDRAGELAELALPEAPPDDEALTIALRDVSYDLARLLDGLGETLPHGAYRDETADALRSAYGSTDGPGGLVEGFARWMARLFSDTELVLLDPQDTAMMRCAVPLLSREIERAGDIEYALAGRDAELARDGFDVQVKPLAGDTNLFLLDDGGRRHKIARDDGGFLLRHSGERLSQAELHRRASDSPERFVPGVLLRPVYQDVLFPTAAFVGGSSEIAYRAQATAVFDVHQRRMAPAFLRSTATILPQRSAELLDQLGLSLADCYCLPEQLAAEAVAADRAGEVDAALLHYRTRIEQAERELEAVACTIDPQLSEPFATLRGNLERHAEKLEKKIVSALKQRHESTLRRLALVQQQVYPRQSPQERVLSALTFLPRHGFGLVRTLLESLDAPSWEHQVLIME